MGWDFFFVYSHHFSPPSALSSHLACTFRVPPNYFILIHLFYMKNHSQHLLPHFLVDAKKEGRKGYRQETHQTKKNEIDNLGRIYQPVYNNRYRETRYRHYQARAIHTPYLLPFVIHHLHNEPWLLHHTQDGIDGKTGPRQNQRRIS